jgi:hypothetical protein
MTPEDEKFQEYVRTVAGLTVMNTRMLIQIYQLHHEFVEKVLPLLPPDPALIRRLSQIEQLSAHLKQAAELLENLQTPPESGA